MARLLISLLFLSLAVLSGAQPFGRFGYVEQTSAPGFVLHHDGFEVNATGADSFQYAKPYSQWRVSDLSDMDLTATVSTAGLCPRKIHISLLSQGFSLYFESGFSFTVHSKACPFLTWQDGSVGPDVPTPPVNWILVSFQESQPPVMFLFPSGGCSVQAGGQAGQWTLRSVDVGPHWIHLLAPLGSASAITSSVAQLGALEQQIAPNMDVWTAPEPTFKSLDIASDDTSVTATWHFDRPNFLIPSAAQFACDGGYLAAVQSPVRDLGIVADNSPLAVSGSADLVVRFPVRKLGKGMAVSLDAQPVRYDRVPTPADVPSILKLALTNLISTCDPKTRTIPANLLTRFITDTQDVPEPFSGEQLPFKGDGTGADLVAAYAVLQAASDASQNHQDAQNPLLLSLMFRRDWDNWVLPDSDQDRQRRTSALAALACLFSGDAYQRLQGAMFEAGLAAQRGLNLWRSHHGLEMKKTFLEPLSDLLAGLFYSGKQPNVDPFAEVLASPLHDVASFPLTAVSKDGWIYISWLSTDTTPQEITLLASPPMHAVTTKNVLTLASNPVAQGLYVRALPADNGFTEIALNPSQPLILPAFAPPPPYSEVRR